MELGRNKLQPNTRRTGRVIGQARQIKSDRSPSHRLPLSIAGDARKRRRSMKNADRRAAQLKEANVRYIRGKVLAMPVKQEA